MKSPFRVLIALFLSVVVSSLFSVEPGESIQSFSVVSGKGEILIKEDLQERVTFLFYEARSAMEVNQALKDYIRSLSFHRDRVLSVAIIDCSDLGLMKRIWQGRLDDHARKFQLDVYGDWNGNMKKNFSFPEGESTFLLISSSGEILYKKTGTISESEFKKIRELAQ